MFEKWVESQNTFTALKETSKSGTWFPILILGYSLEHRQAEFPG